MNRSDRLHALLDGLFRRALDDGDYSYKPHAIRIDRHGWHLLIGSGAAFKDGSLDRFEHPDKLQWRGLERIIVHEPIETALREVSDKDREEIACKMLCLEARQAGEHGRRKYYDASEADLDEANGVG